MKNIHIIQTDKLSKLYVRNDVTPPFYSNFQGKPVNIYITSDEEIKKGDWVYFYLSEEVIKVLEGNFNQSVCKKIILTTDQDRIKDGVQSIDDEFIEWFIKNQGCEEVEVQKWFDYESNPNTSYKIIIPKEESENLKNFKKLVSDEISPALKNIIKEKQETLEDIELEEVIGSRHCQFSVVENKLAIIYRNQLKILQAIKMLNNER
jgi:hypothetical protein